MIEFCNNNNNNKTKCVDFTVCTIVLRWRVVYFNFNFNFFRFLFDSIALSGFRFAYLNVLKCDLSRLIAYCGGSVCRLIKIKPNGFCARHRKREGCVVCSI